MGAVPGFLLVHSVTIEPMVGEGAYGSTFGPAFTEKAFVDESRRLVRDAEGSEVVSEATVTLPLDTVCPEGSHVTLPSGRTADVITARRRDGGGLPTPDHLEVSLT
ncbi:MAG: hypothetical protein ACRDT8_00230 [Micromonosporaceae bacterium]